MESRLGTEELLDIYALLHRYGHLIDAKEWSSLASLFTPDGILDFTQMGLANIVSGRQNIEQFYAELHQPAAHHCTNIEILATGADGQECTVRSKWFVPADSGGIRGGDYNDVLRRTEEGWRFERRQGTRRFG